MISLVWLRARLGLDPSRDDQLTRLRDDVVALWESRTNRLWTERTDHVQAYRLGEKYERKGPLRLELIPATSVSKVEEWEDGESADELAADEYAVVESRSLVKVARVTARYPSLWLPNVQVTYSGGLAVADVPDDIKEALAIQVQYILNRHSGERSILSGITGPGGGVQFMVSADVHPHFKAQALLHRRR